MKLSKLEVKISYRFKNRELLEEACRHSSFVNEQPEAHSPAVSLRDNERLEFLGDAVLNLGVGHMLMDRYPDLPEGDLSRMRAHLVNESELARPVSAADYKSRLQEIVQTTHKVMPTYQVIGESGPDHDKTFAVKITVCDMEAEGIGKSKKTAEQDAARQALEMLENQ